MLWKAAQQDHSIPLCDCQPLLLQLAAQNLLDVNGSATVGKSIHAESMCAQRRLHQAELQQHSVAQNTVMATVLHSV